MPDKRYQPDYAGIPQIDPALQGLNEADPQGARGRYDQQSHYLALMSIMSMLAGGAGGFLPDLLSLARQVQRLPRPQEPPMSQELKNFLEENPELRSLYDKPQSEIPPSGTGGMSHWTPNLPEEPTISPLGQAPEGAVEWNPVTGQWPQTTPPEGFYPPSSLSQYFSRFPYQETQGQHLDVRPPPDLPWTTSPRVQPPQKPGPLTGYGSQ